MVMTDWFPSINHHYYHHTLLPWAFSVLLLQRSRSRHFPSFCYVCHAIITGCPLFYFFAFPLPFFSFILPAVVTLLNSPIPIKCLMNVVLNSWSKHNDVLRSKWLKDLCVFFLMESRRKESEIRSLRYCRSDEKWLRFKRKIARKAKIYKSVFRLMKLATVKRTLLKLFLHSQTKII